MENDVGTNPFYIPVISLFPTLDFLEYIAEKQFGTQSSYGVGVSEIIPMFFSTTNSEWLCLNSEAEFLSSPLGTIAIKNPFNYARPESSPVYVSYGDIRISSSKLAKANSLFLFRLTGDQSSVIVASNYNKKLENITTAPLLDCFSRECLSWFSFDVDWFTGFGYSSQSSASIIVGDEGIILTKSSDILSTIIDNSTASISHTDISIINTISTLTPWVMLQLSTGVSYSTFPGLSNQANNLFLYSVDSNNDSLVAFCHNYTAPLNQGISYDTIITNISFNPEDIIII